MKVICFFLFITLFFFKAVLLAEEGGESSGHEGKGGGNHKSGAELFIGEPYVNIGPFTLSIIKDDVIKGYVQMTINLFSEKKEDYQKIFAVQPRLLNSYIIELSSILGNTWLGGDQPKLEHIKNILQRITNKVLGHTRAQAILFQSYFFVTPKDGEHPTVKTKEAQKKD